MRGGQPARAHECERDRDGQQGQVRIALRKGKLFGRGEGDQHHDGQQDCGRPYPQAGDEQDAAHEFHQGNDPGHESGQGDAQRAEEPLNAVDALELGPAVEEENNTGRKTQDEQAPRLLF